MNEYEVLNVPATATPEEIRAAYRELARRWHPDRFMAGPERDWANEKMAAINAAYRACLNGARQGVKPSTGGEREALKRVQALIDDGKYQSARKLLMGFDTRCAEWNYLFGAILMKLSETEKALIYLSVAAHQAPDCVKYARALKEAQQLNATRRLTGLFSRRVRVGGRT
ncbi:MAG: J domain-containing protein [Clostridia bacterium]|nr:J domain-containing protein [Clostridia bacterium]